MAESIRSSCRAFLLFLLSFFSTFIYLRTRGGQRSNSVSSPTTCIPGTELGSGSKHLYPTESSSMSLLYQDGHVLCVVMETGVTCRREYTTH